MADLPGAAAPARRCLVHQGVQLLEDGFFPFGCIGSSRCLLNGLGLLDRICIRSNGGHKGLEGRGDQLNACLPPLLSLHVSACTWVQGPLLSCSPEARRCHQRQRPPLWLSPGSGSQWTLLGVSGSFVSSWQDIAVLAQPLDSSRFLNLLPLDPCSPELGAGRGSASSASSSIRTVDAPLCAPSLGPGSSS